MSVTNRRSNAEENMSIETWKNERVFNLAGYTKDRQHCFLLILGEWAKNSQFLIEISN